MEKSTLKRIQALSESTPQKTLKTAASILRKAAEDGDSVGKFSALAGHFRKLSPEQQGKLLDAIDAINVEVPEAEAEPATSAD